MAINSVTGSALQGIQRGLQGLRRNASEIASAQNMQTGSPSQDMTRSLVELHQNKLYTLANVKTLKTADQIIGTLLDIKA
jgi:flagellar hook protein FlgE